MKRNALIAAVALAFAGAAQAAVTELVIYKQTDFRGASQTIKGEVANLEGGFAREGSSLIVKGGNWEVCTGDHFKGRCAVLAAGEYPNLGPELGDRIVSVRFVPNKTATVHARGERYADRGDRDRGDRWDRRDGRRDAGGAIDIYGRQDFRGRSIRLDRNERNLAEQNFDGRASSLIVHEGTWELCTEPGFGGQCQTYRPGEYRYLAGLDDRVSSVRQVR